MKRLKIWIILISSLFYAASSHAQGHGHDHSRNEIGLSGGAFYAFDHENWGGGAHLHYFRTLGLHSKWSLGGSLEQAWVDGSHFNISAGVKYQLFERVSVGAFPGVSFFSHDEAGVHDTHESGKARFAFHFELVYDLFHWERYHLGPTVDYSWSKNDSHAMIGLHFAYSF